MQTKTYEIRKFSRNGEVIGTVQANTPAGAKQVWRKHLRETGSDECGQSYWHVHCVTEAQA